MNARIVAAIVEDPDAAPAYLKPPPLLSARFFRLSAHKLKKGCATSFVTLLTVRSLRLTPAPPSGFRSRPVCIVLQQMRLRGACMADFRIPAAQTVFSLFRRSGPYAPPARTSDNVSGKRHAADCGPPRSLTAVGHPAAVPVDAPMSSPYRSGVTDAQATDCKPVATENGGSFHTDRRRVVNHHRDYSEGVLVHNEIHLRHHPVIERHRTSVAATDGRKLVPPGAPAPFQPRHKAGRRS